MQQGSWPHSGSVGPVVAIPIGLLIRFFGHRLLKVVIGLAGFAVGYAAGVMLDGAVHGAPWLIIAAGIVAGLLCAWLAVALYLVGIFLLGLAAFAGVASLVIHKAVVESGPSVLLIHFGLP